MPKPIHHIPAGFGSEKYYICTKCNSSYGSRPQYCHACGNQSFDSKHHSEMNVRSV